MSRWFPATTAAKAALSLLLLVVGLRAATEVGQPVMRVFTPRIYSADAQNFCAVQDADGVMFFGNTNGPLMFDGATWRVIRTGYSENIQGLALAPDNNIYLAGSHQIGFLRPTEDGREFVSLADRLPQGDHDYSVFSRVVARGDAVYFSTRKLVLIWRGGSFQVLPVSNDSRTPIELHVVRDEVLVNVANQPLRRIRDGVLEVVSDDAFFRENPIPFIEGEADGGMLLATDRRGLFRWREGRFTPFATEVDALLRASGLYRARRLRDGSLVLMLANQGGTVLVGADGRFLWRLDESIGLPSRVVLDAVPDREGGLWLCLSTGLARLEWPAAFSVFDRAQGLPGRAWVMARHEGAFYFGAHEGLFRLVPGSAETGNARFETVLKRGVMAVLSQPDGLLAGLFNNGGIVQIGAGEPRKILDVPWSVFALVPSKRDPNRVWLAGADMVASMYRDGSTWRSEGPIKNLPTGTRTLAEMDDGALWTGTMRDGAYRIRFGAPTAAEPRGAAEVTHFNVGTHGLSPKRNTMRVYRWGDRVLLAQGATGLWLLDPATEMFAPLGQAARLEHPNDVALFLSAANPGHLWVQRDTNLPRELAIYRLPREGTPQKLPHAFVDATHFARGWFEEQVAGESVLWVAGNDGLMRIETARAFAAPTAFRVSIRAPGVREGQQLERTRKTLEFESVAPLFRSGGGAQYQTRLIGFETDWSPWTEERRRVFTTLAPGPYRFEVRARDNDGNVSAVASRSFTIRAPWWRTWWFFGLAGLSGVGSVAGVTRWLANRALRRRVALLEAQSAVERERLRLARDLHDEVGSGLGRVILFAGEADRATGDPVKQRAALDRVRRSAQELVQHAREIVWAVSPHHDALASVIERLADYVEETLRGAGIACAAERPTAEKIPPISLGSEARHSLFLAVKEAVHNCVKYSEAKSAALTLRIAGDDFVIALRDDGRGFAAGERRGSGHGLKNIAARAESLGGSAEIASEPGKGTTVTLRVPLRDEKR